MDQCKSEGNCRNNYRCVGGLEDLQTAEEILEAVEDGAAFARVIDIQKDKAGRTFCASKTEDCENGRDDNANGLVDCCDPVCVDEKACEVPPTNCPEDCENELDDDGDGSVDCDDEDCALDPVCL